MRLARSVPTGGTASTPSTIVGLRTALADGSITAVDLMEATLARWRETDHVVHAYAYLDEDAALREACKADRRSAAGSPLGPLHGIPIGVKDSIDTADMPTEGGSAVLAGNRPETDAVVVAALRSSGAIVVGKQRMHEFGFGMNEPATRLLRDPSLYPGGSTAGGGISVAVGSSLAAIGTDGGGSVRKPAAINGLVGLKPTHGSVSMTGQVMGVGSVDHIGWITRSVADSALLWELAREPDAVGRSDVDNPLSPLASLDGISVGCPSYFFRGLEPGIERQVRRGIESMRAAGASIHWFDLPELDEAGAAHSALVAFESYRIHERFVRERPEDYDPRSLAALRSWASVSADDAAAADAVRTRLIIAMESAFSRLDLDVLVTPTLALAPVPLAQMEPSLYLPRYSRLLMPFNLTGQPAISVPHGVDETAAPVGMQIVGARGADSTVLRIAQLVEGFGS